jgi:hypothetical protein
MVSQFHQALSQRASHFDTVISHSTESPNSARRRIGVYLPRLTPIHASERWEERAQLVASYPSMARLGPKFSPT